MATTEVQIPPCIDSHNLWVTDNCNLLQWRIRFPAFDHTLEFGQVRINVAKPDVLKYDIGHYQQC